jgi:hyperosmotically inducible protein
MKYHLRASLVAVLIITCVLASAQNPNSSTSNTPATANTSTGQTHAVTPETASREEDRITREVRHELLMLPYYSVFDDLEYQVQGDTVILKGSVINPVTKNDAENSVKKIEGVDKVVNQIEVLPPSPSDDQLRRELYHRIFGIAGMYRYAMSAVPSIHIIVKNGHVTLKGVVDNQTDKQLAEMQAKSVPGVFSVENDLVVANPKKEEAKKK